MGAVWGRLARGGGGGKHSGVRARGIWGDRVRRGIGDRGRGGGIQGAGDGPEGVWTRNRV